MQPNKTLYNKQIMNNKQIRNTSLQENFETMQAKCQSSVHSWRRNIKNFMKEQYVDILFYFECFFRVFARALTDYSPDSN